MTVNFDHNRNERTGLDEVILAEPKKIIDLEESINAALSRNNKVLITRILKQQIGTIDKLVEAKNLKISWDRYHQTAVIGELAQINKPPQVAILSGGTSDQPVVEETTLTLRYFGINVLSYPDVGVAGIHRHQEVLNSLKGKNEIKILIVVAGNEGALFSVISGQTKLPIIAVPTSIGYGFGGKGQTALQSALQSCSPGVVAVNIDNGFGAASFVKKMLANQS